ncbi:MAG: Xaa-Pro peptidase family protein [Treponema sp.]|nr:Xaa-Pro peptidase family protein [Treponema sp.]
MKEFSHSQIKDIYEKRIKKVVDYLIENSIGAAVFIDNESHREPAIRYFTGHSSDAVFIIYNTGSSVLIPWDIILAENFAICKKIIPFTRYKNSTIDALKANLNTQVQIKQKKVEIPPSTPYPEFLKIVDTLDEWDVRCRENGVHKMVTEMRMIKDEYEIECTREACRIGDVIFEGIQKEVSEGKIKTETDVALYIERKLRENDCERTGFDTLAAGPQRSWAIHCFPNYTSGPWPAKGLSLLDFGVVYKGYTSDQTITIAKKPLLDDQLKLIQIVQNAFDECLKLYRPNHLIKTAAEKANKIFSAYGLRMPHTLGHGIGLEIHEYPRVSASLGEDLKFQPGMILTLEPGLYDEELGGCRLENDILITEYGNEVLTHSKILVLE